MSELIEDLVSAVGPPPEACDLRAGDRLGRFEIVRELGRGGFGAVYEARDASLRRGVAVKVLRRMGGERAARALVEEAEAAAQLQHPNIVTLYDVGSHDGNPYFVMELLRGTTLANRLERGRLPVREAIVIAVQIARGLAHAHGRGVLHRDLTPGNVFLCDYGTVKLLDFGLSRLFGGEAKAGGTPGYAAPEQWRGEDEDARADVFALGVIIHRMVTGELPYPVPASPEAPGRRGGQAEPPSPPGHAARMRTPRTGPLPRGLAALVRRMISVDKRERPADGQILLDALLRAQRTSSQLRSRGVLLLAIAVALAAGRGSARRATTSREPMLVAVADDTNEAGDGDLDALSGLLITSLEQVAQRAGDDAGGEVRRDEAAPHARLDEPGRACRAGGRPNWWDEGTARLEHPALR